MLEAVLSQAVMCMALNIYHESRGEPLLGRMAVASVTMNRADGKVDNICPTVKKPSQFSWYTPKTPLKKYLPKKEDKSWIWSEVLATVYVYGLIPPLMPGNLTHYHSTEVSPNWSKSDKLQKFWKIGGHMFYVSLRR